jgi:hypothetical protein
MWPGSSLWLPAHWLRQPRNVAVRAGPSTRVLATRCGHGCRWGCSSRWPRYERCYSPTMTRPTGAVAFRSTAQGPHRGRRRGCEGVLPAASLALPPRAELPEYPAREAFGDLSQTWRNPPIWGPNTRRPASLPTRNSSPRCAARSTEQIPTVGSRPGKPRGWRGSFPDASPRLFPPTDQPTHPKGPRISILPTPTQTRESGGSHAGVASPDPASPTLDYPCQTDVATAGPTSGDQAITSSSLCTAHPTGRCAGPVSPDASSPTATQMTARATRR